MNESSNQLVQRLWSYCNLLRDDGFSNSEYVEQLTYLLFLKMADERSRPPFFELDPLPERYSWHAIKTADGLNQLDLYQRILIFLGGRPDLFGTIFRNSSSRFRDPLKFKKLVSEIDSLEWSQYDSDIKGDAYEGLLERTASDSKSGAGQYFTPRALVDAVVEVIQPQVGETVCDPACGTGGFLLSWIVSPTFLKLGEVDRRRILNETVTGVELVESVARLCLMNLVLHGIGGVRNPIRIDDSLTHKPSSRFNVILANPPFGKKSSFVIGNIPGDRENEGDSTERSDFWVATSNKQLNFVQHIYTLLEDGGRAAVVVPDNVLFEGGAGEVIRRNLLSLTNLHTMLRLPTGIFYAQGVRANVLFFNRLPVGKTSSDGKLWIYDLRTNKRFTLKGSPLKKLDLSDFVEKFSAKSPQSRQVSERFRCYSHEEILLRDRANFDISWLRDDSIEDASTLPTPQALATMIMENLAAAQEEFASVANDYGQETADYEDPV